MGGDSLPLKNYWLPTRFKAFFSRHTKSKNQTVVVVEDDFVAAEVEDAMASVQNEVINQMQPIHPVTFDDYNLCDLVATGRLCKLTVPVLRDIFCHFEPEMSSKSQQLLRRKAPYVEILEKHVRACSCFDTLTASWPFQFCRIPCLVYRQPSILSVGLCYGRGCNDSLPIPGVL